MRRFLYFFAAVLAANSLISCSKYEPGADIKFKINNPEYGIWQSASEPPVRFELQQTYGADSGIVFSNHYSINNLATDGEGNLYVADGQTGILYSFAPDGSLRWQTGEKGRGPGDFENPLGLAVAGGFIYVSNINGSRIDVFNSDGNFVKSKLLEDLDLDFGRFSGILNDNLLIISTVLWGEAGNRVSALNLKNDFAIAGQLEARPVEKISLDKGLALSLDVGVADTLIAVADMADYFISFYNLDGEIEYTVARDFNKLMRPGTFVSDGMISISSFSRLSVPYFLSGTDYFLVALHWAVNIADPDAHLRRSLNTSGAAGRNDEARYRNSVDVYHKDGTLLYSLESDGETPETGNLVHTDMFGNIYTVNTSPAPHIRRYKVVVTEPEL